MINCPVCDSKINGADWHLSAEHINHLQDAFIEELVRVCQQAHYIDVRVRINGAFRNFQGDWIKWLKRFAVSETAQTKEKHGLHDGLRDEPAPSGVAASSQEKVTETLDWNEDKMPYQHWCDECNAVFIGGKERRTCKACVTRRNDKTRSQKIHEHDCPQVWEFYRKHSMGSKLCPSCLLCGNAEPDRERWAITHMELPDIYICAPCVNAARSATQRSKWRLDEIVSYVLEALYQQRGLRYPMSHSDMRLVLREAELYLESISYASGAAEP